jgi:aminoglycoside phosphotransferase (APT) family kinase protein
LDNYYQIRPVQDREHLINGLAVPKLSDLLKEVDWEKLSEGIPTLFHGDFQPENIICNEEQFTFIDWRQDFNGELEFGDLYYDFAKLHHALILNANMIRNNEYMVKREGGYVEFELNIKSNLLEFLFVFEKYIKEKGYDIIKVKTLSALMYLNIAPLHHTPYSELLYFLGKRFLYNILHSKGVFP